MRDFLRLKSNAESKTYDKHGNNPLVWIEVGTRRRKESKY
jgi:hypothetical protein